MRCGNWVGGLLFACGAQSAHLLALISKPDDVARVSEHGFDAHVVVHLLLEERGLSQLLCLFRQQEGVKACELWEHEQHIPAQRTRSHLLNQLRCLDFFVVPQPCSC